MPRPTVHPGKVLAEELEALGVTPTELSRQIAVPPNRISQIIHGKRAITGDTALRLAHWFKTSPEFWLNLQAAHDLRIAEESAGSAIRGLPTRPGKLRSMSNDPASRKSNRTG
jgi:addiction module HigA family antidote